MRHKERHTARGASLLRKDTFMQNLNPIVTAAMANKNGSAGKKASPTVSFRKREKENRKRKKNRKLQMLTVHRCNREHQNARLGCSPLHRELARVRRERKCRRRASIPLRPIWAARIR